jgi:hypothetical protein
MRCAIHLKSQVIYTQRHAHDALFYLPYMAGSMIGIADAVRDSPEMPGNTYAASFTRRAVDLPYMAGSMIGIAHAMRDSPEMVR